ncbi:MAG: vWA domain-containing protein [Methylocella sp.]
MSRRTLRDPRLWLLMLALCLLLATLAAPHVARIGTSYRVLVIADVTGSMNTRDYALDGKPESRLDAVRRVMRQAIAALPCPSTVGLGIFTERRAFLLFDPVDVCENFAPVNAALAALDWRMAWEGDSHIAEGLYSAINLARDLDSDLAFLTDGQEAPPLSWSGGPAFEGKPGAVKGLIVGVGGYSLSPIPKLDDAGREIGFYGPDDVAQDNRFGLPPPDASTREGYNPRNAPFGGVKAVGNEHLSSVREAYLKELGAKTGLAYTHLVDAAGLVDALSATATPHPTPSTLDLRPVLAAFALAALVAVYGFAPLFERGVRRRKTRRQIDSKEPHWRVAA